MTILERQPRSEFQSEVWYQHNTWTLLSKIALYLEILLRKMDVDIEKELADAREKIRLEIEEWDKQHAKKQEIPLDTIV